MDITGANYSNGTLIEWWTCNGGANQQWQAVNGQLVNPASGKCLDDPNFNTANGTQLILWACNGGSHQPRHLPPATRRSSRRPRPWIRPTSAARSSSKVR